jgi:uncharacterized membrane protein
MRDIFLIVHFLGLSMGLGVGFAHLFLGIASKKWTEDEMVKIYTKIIRPLDIMGHIGMGLLIISGLGMLHPYFPQLAKMPMLHAKFTLVIILMGMIIYLTKKGKKFVQTQDKDLLPQIEWMGSMAHFVGMGVVVCAVLAFH